VKESITIDFVSAALEPTKVQVRRVEGRERLSQLFEFEIHLVTTDPTGIDERKLLTEGCAIVFSRQVADNDPEEVRRIHGMVRRVRDRLFTESSHAEVVLEVVPRVWQSTLTVKSDVFQDLDVSQLIDKKLSEGLELSAGDDFAFQLDESYEPREFVVQYEESDLAFMQRWAEHLGVFYFFDHSGDRDKIVFTDANNYCPALEPFERRFVGRGETLGVYELERPRWRRGQRVRPAHQDPRRSDPDRQGSRPGGRHTPSRVRRPKRGLRVRRRLPLQTRGAPQRRARAAAGRGAAPVRGGRDGRQRRGGPRVQERFQGGAGVDALPRAAAHAQAARARCVDRFDSEREHHRLRRHRR
jgi:hypothetical protein